ncbi:MAG: protein kinase [Myxococcaceae bacterium]|jgi:serine/threonine-protein kinase|nr:protein kinase [Myxococcaceae bacterium]
MDLVFGKYEIQHRLAIGGMGEVFYALQKGVPGFERPVILKSLLPELAQQDGFIDQFLDEARVAATLNHPNVVSIFEVGQWNGTYYLAMEYIRGRNLAQLMRRAAEQQHPVPAAVVARIVRDAALGLDHAHRATDGAGQPLHVVHRDISPQNIMVREDGLTKVVDFGIARASNRASRTDTGVLKGKLSYMAPEQILATGMGPAVDQFALGVVLWELLAHRRLFKADRDLDVMTKVLEEPLLPPSSVTPVPASLDAVTMRMLERDPSQRFPSCAEVAAALDAAMAELGPAESPADFMRRLGTDDLVVRTKATAQGQQNFVIALKPQGATSSVQAPSPPPARAPRTGLVVGAVLAALVAGAGMWVVTRSATEPAPAPPLVAVPQPPPAPPTPAPLPTLAPVPPDEPAPTPRAATLTITTTPAKATVRVDGKPLGPSPQTLELSPGETHYLLVEKAGFKRAEQDITLSDGESKALTVTLTALEPTKRPPPPRSEAPLEPGFLTLETEPWTKVAVDGEPLGSTPLFKKRLPAGRHQLVLVNEGANVNEQRSITIAPNETTKLKLKLK